MRTYTAAQLESVPLQGRELISSEPTLLEMVECSCSAYWQRQRQGHSFLQTASDSS